MEAIVSLNYVMLGSNDVIKARAYYDAVLPLIGGTVVADYMPHTFCYQLRGGGRIWVARPYNRETAAPGNGNTVGLLCASKDEVDAVHAAALANGASNEGDPGPRPQYGPDVYGAYVRDLDGNKMSFVYFGGET
jgi:catechol 2,3-dioxygenase-like lactoylglutathione lyase family enzyme